MKLSPLPAGMILQAIFVGILAAITLQGKPPADAQEARNVEDAVQDSRIEQNRNFMTDMAIKQTKMGEQVASNSLEISGIRGEERGLAGVLILLQVGSFVFQVKKNGGRA